ncbi:TatD family hydrolase [Chloroflexota bacterium]
MARTERVERPMYQLIDTHAHLEEIENLEPSITDARDSGLVAIITVGSDDKSNREALQIANSHPGLVYPALGLHPSRINLAEIEHTLEFIEANIADAIAIGEIGLDYHKRVRAQADKELQQTVLRQLLHIASRHDKPVSLHSRYAWHDALKLTNEVPLEKVVFHWYTGTSSVLREIISRGYFLSVTPAVTYHEEHRRTVKETPLEQLLLETDSPVVYGRGREFEFEARPADVLVSLKGIAGIKGLDEAEAARVTSANARRLFRLK